LKPRQPERDYSHRLLIDKLGVKSGQKIAILGVESADFLTELAARVPDYSRGKRINEADLVFFSAEVLKDLANLKSLSRSIAKTGAIWVVYPKGQTHLREIDVIEAGKSAGLTDNKVCRFSDTHTHCASAYRQRIVEFRGDGRIIHKAQVTISCIVEQYAICRLGLSRS
jgi:hypothetical protein